MVSQWRHEFTRQMAAQLAEPRGVWGRVTGALMNVVNADINRQAVQLLALNQTDQVLEIGFGGGTTLPALLRYAGAGRVAGIELSETMLVQARASHAQALSTGHLELVAGDAATLPWGDGSFDRVLTVNTLYFWENPLAVFADVRRVLKRGGRFVLAYRPKTVMDRLPVSAYGFRVYSDDTVLALLHNAGLEVIEMTFGGRGGHAHICVVATPSCSELR